MSLWVNFYSWVEKGKMESVDRNIIIFNILNSTSPDTVI